MQCQTAYCKQCMFLRWQVNMRWRKVQTTEIWEAPSQVCSLKWTLVQMPQTEGSALLVVLLDLVNMWCLPENIMEIGTRVLRGGDWNYQNLHNCILKHKWLIDDPEAEWEVSTKSLPPPQKKWPRLLFPQTIMP